MFAILVPTGIPSLDHHEPNQGENVDVEHPGAQVAAAAAAMDDGLGAFRPSTSFNDLTSLIPPQSDKNTAPTVAPATNVGNQPATKPATGTKKRAAPAPSSPAAKRKATAATAKARKAPTKKQASPAGATKNRVVAPKPIATSAAQPSSVKPASVVTPATTEAISAAAVRAVAKATATSFPPLPELSGAKPDTKIGVSLTMKPEDKSKVAPAPVASAPVKTAVTKPAQPVAASAAAKPASTNQDVQFKSIAQQAVSNLIQNANTARTKSTTASVDKSVDTSTAHIKALTGNNWVAACTGSVTTSAPAPAAPVSAPAPTSTQSSAAAAAAAAADKNNRARRQNLTPDERARQNRDRNREHARNTRLRKKAYVEELKRTLTELVAQRDAADVEKRQAAQRELEQREVRFRVIEEFLKLRGRNEGNFARWAAILEDGFVLTVPSAPMLYKNTPGGEATLFEQQLSTVQLVMAESTVFSGFLQTVRSNENTLVTVQFDCDRKNFFMDSCNAVLEWTATAVGAKDDLHMKGVIRAKFCPASNKLVSASISFDSAIIYAQIHKSPAAGEAAAQAAASQADAILDSLEINHVHLNVVSPSDISEKGESSDEQSTGDVQSGAKAQSVPADGEKDADDGLGTTTRRVHRRD